MDVFADQVGITVPRDEWAALRSRVAPLLDEAGMVVDVSGDDGALWRQRREDGPGTVKAIRRGAIWCLGTSGAALTALRAARLFGEYLRALGEGPHRVTRLDATTDVLTDAAPVVAEVSRLGYAGELALTRKSVLPQYVTRFMGQRFDGVESGTVYVGSHQAEVRLVVYDKAHERWSKCQVTIPHTARYELRLFSGVGCSLRDCYDPSAVFWHYMPGNVLARPSGVPAWSPGGDGYVVGDRAIPAGPAALLRKRVSDSPEIGRLLELAESSGPYGFELLVSCLRQRYAGAVA
jgi:hypothetical protein